GLEVGKLRSALAGPLGVAALGHETGNHAVERRTVVEAALDELLDAVNMVRGSVRPKQDDDLAAVRQFQRQLVRRVGGDRRRRNQAERLSRRRRIPGRNQRQRYKRQREQGLTHSKPSRISSAD